MKEKVKQLDDQAKKIKELERSNQLLETTLKAKNPNSIPMMIKASKDTTDNEVDSEAYKEAKSRVKTLE